MPVDFYGQACDLDAYRTLADQYGLDFIKETAQVLLIDAKLDQLDILSELANKLSKNKDPILPSIPG